MIIIMMNNKKERKKERKREKERKRTELFSESRRPRLGSAVLPVILTFRDFPQPLGMLG
jgi:hypothetical protein